MALLTLDDAKGYLRVDSADEDAMIGSLLSSAGRLCMDVARLTEEQWAVIDSDAEESEDYSADRLATIWETVRVAMLYALGYLFRFYENGREIKRFKNIEIPDAIKELEFQDFRFDVPESGPITFKIFFRPGTLPETWPEARQRKTRDPKDADPMPMPEQPAQDAMEAALTAAMDQARGEGQPMDEIAQAAAQGAEITTEIIDAADDGHEIIITAEDDPQDDPQPEALTVHYDVPGSARKALANAIGEAIGAYPAYQAAPTFAYIIGDYTLDRQGILTGPHNAYLLGFLAQDGYQTK